MLKAIKTLVCVLCFISAIVTESAVADSLAALKDTVTTIEREEGPLSKNLYGPLRRLGLRYQEEGLHQASLAPFRHMQHLVHRTDGVNSTLQTESVEHIIRAYIAMGEVHRADIQHEFIFNIAERAYAPEHESMHAARWKLAGWYRATQRNRDALELYASSLELRLAEEQRNEIAIIQLLRAEALTMYISGRCCASEKLAQVWTLAKDMPDFDRQDKQRFAMEYADMLMLEKREDEAHARYLEVAHRYQVAPPASMLGMRRPESVSAAIVGVERGGIPASRVVINVAQDDWLIVDNREKFPLTIGDPVPVCSETVRDSVTAASSEKLGKLYADVNMTVDATGRARQIDVTGNTPARLTRYLKAVLEETRYRPGITQHGVEESALSFRQTFSADAPAMTDNLAGWNALLTTQSCRSFHQGNAVASAD